MSSVNLSIPDTSQESQPHKKLHRKSKENVNCDLVIRGTDERIQLEQE